MRARLVLAAAALAACCAPAAAQPPDSAAMETRIRIIRAREGMIEQVAPGVLRLRDQVAPEAPPASQRPFQPLTPAQAAQLSQAQALRADGQLEPAGTALAPLLAALPHHPAVLTEQARLLLAKQDFAAVERLGRAERTAQKDSLLMARELSLALERLGRPRDAAGVALAAWVASPFEAGWAQGTIMRLAPADARGVRELMRRAVAGHAARTDLVLAKALLDWRAGDLRVALETLERADRPAAGRAPLRWDFAQQLAWTNAPRDSGAAVEALVQLAGDDRFDSVWRLSAAQRAWELEIARGGAPGYPREARVGAPGYLRGARVGAPTEGGSGSGSGSGSRSAVGAGEVAPALARALQGVPLARWPTEFLVALARGLREAGRTDEARSLLRSGGAPPGAVPQLDLEEALADLRDGPPERALPRLRALAGATPEGAWRYAEALFFAGQSDSALAWYQRIAEDAHGPFSGAALERAFLIEDAEPRAALPAFGRIAYEEWRGDRREATVLTDSLVRTLPRGPLWAQAALLLAAQRDAADDARGALEPLLAVADSLPDDRLAPLARQRAGDLYLTRLKDERAALAQYEECLARYPKAWNAPEVRRRAETLRRERRF